MKKRLEKLIAEYGAMAFAVYFTIFILSMVGFVLAIKMGVAVDGTAAEAGTLAAAWVATKVIQPIRIGATLILAPFLTHLWRRVRPRKLPVQPSSQGQNGQAK